MREFTFSVTDLNERLFVEQALSFYREMRKSCQDAPSGQVLARGERVALHGGRELTRRGFEAVLNEQAREVEKKGLRGERVRNVKAAGGTEDAGGVGI